MDPINKQEESYLKARGFTFVEGEPNDSTIPPYLLLDQESELGLMTPSLQYIGLLGGPAGIMHPNNLAMDELINDIEKIVAEYQCTGHTTETGEPIPIFALDKSWMPVVRRLCEKYPSRK